MTSRPYDRDYVRKDDYEADDILVDEHLASTSNPHSVTYTQVGGASSSHLHTGVYEPASGDIQSHLIDTGNPHSVTYTQVGAAASGHDHDDDYLGIISTASNSLLLGGSGPSYYAISTHDHDEDYLGISSTASNSQLLDTHDSTYFATSDHIHDMDDVVIDTTLRLRPQIDFGKITKSGATVPSSVDIGVYSGYSLPIFNDNDEEISFRESIPRRWDGASDIKVGCMAALAATNDGTVRKFKLNIDWEHFASNSVVPTSYNSASSEITVAASAAQYQSYPVEFIIDYDIDGGGNEVKANEVLGCRLRRITSSGTAYAGEVIVFGFYTQYNRDKIGV